MARPIKLSARERAGYYIMAEEFKLAGGVSSSGVVEAEVAVRIRIPGARVLEYKGRLRLQLRDGKDDPFSA